MAESSDELDLDAFIMYDIFKWKTAAQSYKNYSKVCYMVYRTQKVGFKEFEIKFNEYTERSCNELKEVKTVSKISDIRLCILSDVLREKSFQEVYQNLLDAFGINNFVYGDLDFWYYRFYHGRYNLDYDRSIGPKRLEFSDLPLDIIRIVTDNLSWKSQLCLRKVYSKLRQLIDGKKPPFKTMSLHIEIDHIYMSFDSKYVFYTTDKKSMSSDFHWYIEDDNYRKLAFDDLAYVLKNPKLVLENFFFSMIFEDVQHPDYDRTVKEVRNVFENVTHKITVKEVELAFDTNDVTTSVLSSFKPRTLRGVSLCNENKPCDMDEIAKLEQWKALEECDLESLSSKIEHFYHMKKFEICVPSLSVDDLLKLQENCANSTDFNTCHVYNKSRNNNIDVIVAGLNLTPYSIENKQGRQYKSFIWPIPNSRDILQFQIDKNTIAIDRKKNNGSGINIFY